MKVVHERLQQHLDTVAAVSATTAVQFRTLFAVGVLGQPRIELSVR